MLSHPGAVVRDCDCGNDSNGLPEKRRHQRLSASVDGEIKYGDATTRVTTLDLSKSGALLKLVKKPYRLPRIGDTVDLALVWPLGGQNGALHVEARLVRVTEDKVAVEFTHIKSLH